MHPLQRLFKKNCQNTLYAMKFTLYQEAIHLANTLNEHTWSSGYTESSKNS